MIFLSHRSLFSAIYLALQQSRLIPDLCHELFNLRLQVSREWQ
jgi:hypothetical protein